MRRFFVLLLVAGAPAFSQYRGYGPPLFPTGFAGIGATAPVNPTATRLDAGWNLMGGFGVTTGYFGATVDGLFTSFGMNDGTLRRAGARSGYERIGAITVNPHVHVNPRGPADFYITGGAGVYIERIGLRAPASNFGLAANYDLVRTETHGRFGVNGGAGFAFAPDPQARWQFFVEARYHYVVTGDRPIVFIPVSVGVRF